MVSSQSILGPPKKHKKKQLHKSTLSFACSQARISTCIGQDQDLPCRAVTVTVKSTATVVMVTVGSFLPERKNSQLGGARQEVQSSKFAWGVSTGPTMEIGGAWQVPWSGQNNHQRVRHDMTGGRSKPLVQIDGCQLVSPVASIMHSPRRHSHTGNCPVTATDHTAGTRVVGMPVNCTVLHMCTSLSCLSKRLSAVSLPVDPASAQDRQRPG